MNFERKTNQNQFLPILSDTQEQKLEKICQTLQVRGHFHHGHSQRDTFRLPSMSMRFLALYGSSYGDAKTW